MELLKSLKAKSNKYVFKQFVKYVLKSDNWKSVGSLFQVSAAAALSMTAIFSSTSKNYEQQLTSWTEWQWWWRAPIVQQIVMIWRHWCFFTLYEMTFSLKVICWATRSKCSWLAAKCRIAIRAYVAKQEERLANDGKIGAAYRYAENKFSSKSAIGVLKNDNGTFTNDLSI